MEIEKDLRLPAWAGSWLQVAQKLECQDYYEHCANHDDPVIGFDPLHHSVVKSEILDPKGVVEYFEGDSYTVKGRAFDEIIDVIPDLEVILKMRDKVAHAFHFYTSSVSSDEDPVLKFLNKLIELKTRRK